MVGVPGEPSADHGEILRWWVRWVREVDELVATVTVFEGSDADGRVR